MDSTRNPIRTYSLVVCFSSLFVGAVALVIGLYDILQISFPEATNTSFQMQLEQAAQQQKMLADQLAARANSDGESVLDGTIATDLASIQIPKPNHTYFINSAIQSLILSTIVLIVSASIFFFHWRLARGR